MLPYRIERGDERTKRKEILRLLFAHCISSYLNIYSHAVAQSDAPWDVNIDRREEVNPGVSILIGVKR